VTQLQGETTMLRRHALFTPLLAAACAHAGPADDPDAAFQRVAARYFRELMDLDPLNASAIVGWPQYEGRMEIGIAPAAIANTKVLHQRVARELLAARIDELSPVNRLSHELLSWEVNRGIDALKFPEHLMPINQFGGVPMTLANMGAGDQAQPLKTPADYANYFKRLKRLPEFNRQAIANMRQGMQQGYTAPRALIDTALAAFDSMAEPVFEKSPFAQALNVMPASFTKEQRERITAELYVLVTQFVQPAMHGLAAFLQGPYRTACRTSAGIGALPDGAAWYAHLVRLHTSTDYTPTQIHYLGLSEVDRIRGQIAKLQKHFGFEGSVTQFLQWHANEARFRPHTTWAQVIKSYEEINARIVPQLPRYFGRQPRQPLQLRAMPELLRESASPYYNPPTADGQRPGIFFIGAPGGPGKFNNSVMTSLMLHEGQPGHHYQISLQQELELPDFRRYGFSTAYGEGWALYAETLGHEMGLYADPNQHLGHLKFELLRAVRLVADTGLHARGWTREQTLRYMIDTEGQTEPNARQATERYMALPGQALGYKVGALQFQALRQRAKEKMGDRFSLAAYHDLVLSQGTVTMKVLERLVDAWIAGGDQANAGTPRKT
jgi:uncharacterized protein (DUF885 family)